MIGQTDMTMSMQRHAMQCATYALETHAIRDCQSIAQSLKQVYTHITISFTSLVTRHYRQL